MASLTPMNYRRSRYFRGGLCVCCRLLIWPGLLAAATPSALAAQPKVPQTACSVIVTKAPPAAAVPLDIQDMRREAEELEKAGRFEEAALLSQRVLSAKSRLYGLYHPEIAAGQSNLAGLYMRLGRYAMAESLYKEALAIYECTLGKGHLDTAAILSNLARFYERQGRYGIAEQLYREVLTTFGTILGERHRRMATPLNNLGMLLYDLGRYQDAKPLLVNALEIRDQEFDPEDPMTATSLSNLGLLYIQQKNYTDAEMHLERALSILRKVLGPAHPDTAAALNNLAFLYSRQDRVDAALQLSAQALRARRRSLPADHPLIANSLNNLGMLYWSEYRYLQAEPLFQQALEIRQATLGSEHPETMASLNNLAVLKLQQSRSTDAQELLTRLSQGQGAWLRQELPLQPREMRRHLLSRQPNAVNLAFALLHQHPAAIRLAFDTRLNQQGLLAEIERRQRQLAGSTKKTRDLAEWIAGIDQQLASISISKEQRPLLQKQRRLLERELNRLLPELQIDSVSVTQVAAALRAVAPQGVLVEFQRYRPLQQRQTAAGLWGAARYVALLLHADGRIVSIPLGDAGPIDHVVRRALTASASNSLLLRTEAAERWQQLSDLVLAPLLPELRNVRELFISPDGGLHRVPFAALPAPGDRSSLLNEVYRLRLLTTGRDLLRLQQPGREGGTAVLIANPAYNEIFRRGRIPIGGARRGARSTAMHTGTGLNAADGGAEGQRRSGELSKAIWPPLPGTAREAYALAPLLKVARPITAKAATATLVLQQKGPRILHIATHGFFQPDQPAPPPHPLADARASATLLREDPLLRSGLVMAGANHPEADPSDDGYLTAAEVTGMDLQGTELVTLSACQSGLGDIQTGEGVYGLQRALAVAGARSTLLSLWSVDDEGTRAFMEAYYTRLMRGQGRADALAHTQKAFRSHANRLFRDVYVWGSFQLAGDWRPIPKRRSSHRATLATRKGLTPDAP